MPGAGLDVQGRPGQGRAVGVGRVRGGQGQGHRLGLGQLGVLDVGAQPVHRGRHGELGGAEVFDEVAAAAAAGFLEPGQHLVHQAEAAQDAAPP